jgi:WD40 repeat protein
MRLRSVLVFSLLAVAWTACAGDDDRFPAECRGFLASKKTKLEAVYGTFRWKHVDPVNAVAFSPNGKKVLSASTDHDLRLWDASRGETLLRLSGHEGPVRAVAFSPGGHRAVSASDDKTARVWDLATGQCLFTLAHAAAVRAVAYTNDGKRVLTGSADATLDTWNVETGEHIATYPAGEVVRDGQTGHAGHTRPINCIAFLADGRAVSGANDGLVGVWDLGSTSPLQLLSNGGCVVAVAGSPDGKRVLAQSQDGVVQVWDLAKGKVVHTIQPTNAGPGHGCGLSWSPDGKRFAIADDAAVRLMDASSFRVAKTIATHHFGLLYAVAFSADGALLATGGHDRCVKVHDVTSGIEPDPPEGNLVDVGRLCVAPDGSSLVTAGPEGLRLFDLATGKEGARLEGHAGAVIEAWFSPDGKKLVSSGIDGTLRVWDASSAKLLSTIKAHKDAEARCVAVSADGKLALSGGSDHLVKEWDLATGKLVATLAGHKDTVESVELSPDGKLALSASLDRTLKIWDVATGKEVRALVGHESKVFGASFYKDATRVISWGDDKTLMLWDAATGEEAGMLKGHASAVTHASVSPDGKLAISVSNDQTVRLWDLDTAQEVDRLVLETARDYAWGTAFSSDGKFFVVGTARGLALRFALVR